jgi:hypothetical protein
VKNILKKIAVFGRNILPVVPARKSRDTDMCILQKMVLNIITIYPVKI